MKQLENIKTIFPFSLITIIITALCIFLWKGINYNCFHATDFSIYQQAIYDIAANSDLNPYLTIRNINIFNDHFDPAILIAVPIVKLFNYSAHALTFFEVSWLVIFLVSLRLIPELKKENKIWFMVLTLLTKGILTGFQFPIHPSTWSLVPILFLINSVHSHIIVVLLNSIFLMSFREIFPLALIPFSTFYLVNKKYKHFFYIFITSVIWSIWVFKLREFYLGPTYNYGGETIYNILANPIQTILSINYLPILKVFLAFILPYYYILKGEKWSSFKTSKTFAAILLWLPMGALHIILGKVHFQYGVFLCTPLLIGMFTNKKFNTSFTIAKNKILIVTIFYITASGTLTKIVNQAFLDKSNKCIINDEKLKSSLKLEEVLKSRYQKDETILATGGVIPRLLKPNEKWYQIGIFSKQLPKYDYLILERPGSGDIFPLSKNTIDKCWTYYQKNKIYEDNYYLLAKNIIAKDCIHNNNIK